MDFAKHPIWQVVEKLLYKHDCVIIPGFGGFVCNVENARIDQVTHVIIPPGKHVVFNPNLKTNDGLLIANYATNQHITYNDALILIDDWVAAFKSFLLEEKNLEIPHFGRFRINAEANYVFIPERANRYDLRSFGLTPLQAQVVGSRQIKTKSARVFKDLKPAKPLRAKSKTRFWQTTLAATLCLLLLVNSWIYFAQPDKNFISQSNLSLTSWFDSSEQDHTATPPASTTNSIPADIQPEEKISPKEPVEVTQPEEITETAQPVDVLQNLCIARTTWIFPPEMVQPETVTNADELIEVAAIPTSTQSNYYVIAGVFCIPKNAVNYVNELKNKGINAQVLQNPSIKCNRVSVGGFSNKADAETFLQKAKQEINPDAWVLATN
jgi:nucleoid DNA-binding protein/cell division septation protein DedD